MEAQHSRNRILVVDDDATIRRVSAAVLQFAGYRVESAADGEQAWSSLSAATYDLVITDHEMPNGSGVQLLAKLRASRLELPVIMVTGSPPLAYFDQHPLHRPEALLLKPFSVAALLETVRGVLLKGEARPARERPEPAPAAAYG